MFKLSARLLTLSTLLGGFTFAASAATKLTPFSEQDDGIAYAYATLIARASLNDGYSLPAGTILGIADVKVNNNGDVAFDVDVLGQSDQRAAIWYVPKGQEGRSIYSATISGRFVSTPGLNNHGDVVFTQFDLGVTDGVFKSEGASRALSLLVRPDSDAAFSATQINNNNKALMRVMDAYGDQSFRVIENGVSKVIAREGIADQNGATASFLFQPVLNNHGLVAAKVRLGERGQVENSQPDVIRLWKADGSYENIATDIDGQPSSLFLGFSNSVGISDNKHVVFVAEISGNKQAIFLYGEGRVKAVAIEGQGDLAAIEAFAPVVNAQGQVAFRGRMKNGKSAIFLGNWDGFRAIVKQGDILPSDVGTIKIYDLEDHQGFIGGLSLNDNGVLGFHVGLLSKDGANFLGQGIYLLSTRDLPDARR